ncbi:MAG: hypothetical protein QXM86_01555 [Candidatus Bathyarchaeia archaeon]
MAQILEVLEDGEWHMVRELQEIVKLSEKKIRKALEFLRDYGFIVTDEKRDMIKLEENVKKFLR